MNKIFNITVILFFTMMGLSCTKETQISEGNPTPTIKFVSASPLNIKQFEDSLKVTFAYEDGDGDLGEENPDINSLEILDERLSAADYYFVPPMAPVGSKIQIKGTLTVKIRNMFLLGTGSTETTTLELRLRDRSGKWSNKIKTPVITITK